MAYTRKQLDVNGDYIFPFTHADSVIYTTQTDLDGITSNTETNVKAVLDALDNTYRRQDTNITSLYNSQGKRGFLYQDGSTTTAFMELPTQGDNFYFPKLKYDNSGNLTVGWQLVGGNTPNLEAIEALTGTGVLKRTGQYLWELDDHVAGAVSIVNHGTSDTTFSLTPNLYHVWGSVASLTLTLATPEDATIVNEYQFKFTSPTIPTTLSLPATVDWVTELDIEPNKTYWVSIIDNLAAWLTSDMVIPMSDANTPEYATKAYVDAGLALKEDVSNKVTSIDENSTNTQYPSAKCVYDALNPSEE